MNHKHIFYFVLIAICTLSINIFAQSGAQFDNSGFEQWTTRASEPVHWHSSGTATGSYAGMLSSQVEATIQTRPGSSGIKSIRIFPKSVWGITANGNLTNGRMNAGSMSASGSGNYNYTQRSQSLYNTPINSVPDSIVVWVCFRSESSSQKAQLHAVVHGNADYKLIADGTEEPTNMRVASARCNFTRTSPANGVYNWTRLSIPFVKDGPCNDPRYILFTITTNQNPGQGSTNDDLFVDDIQLIYNPNRVEENEITCELSPNPFTNQLHIKALETIHNIGIYDLQGHCIRSLETASNDISLDLGDLPSGLYLIQLDCGSRTIAKRIIKY